MIIQEIGPLIQLISWYQTGEREVICECETVQKAIEQAKEYSKNSISYGTVRLEINGELHSAYVGGYGTDLKIEKMQPTIVDKEIVRRKLFMDPYLDEIRRERSYQNKKWGDIFDSKNTPNDWVAYITQYTGKAVTMPFDETTYRKNLIKVATLCVAALENLDKHGLVKRHYD